MDYIVGVVVILAAFAAWLFLSRAQNMSEGKKALCLVGGAVVVVVMLIAVFGAFYESAL